MYDHHIRYVPTGRYDAHGGEIVDQVPVLPEYDKHGPFPGGRCAPGTRTFDFTDQPSTLERAIELTIRAYRRLKPRTKKA